MASSAPFLSASKDMHSLVDLRLHLNRIITGRLISWQETASKSVLKRISSKAPFSSSCRRTVSEHTTAAKSQKIQLQAARWTLGPFYGTRFEISFSPIDMARRVAAMQPLMHQMTNPCKTRTCRPEFRERVCKRLSQSHDLRRMSADRCCSPS